MRSKRESRRAPPSSYKPSNGLALAKSGRRTPLGKRCRGDYEQRAPFIPSEDWYEPDDHATGDYRILVHDPGLGYRHVVTPREVRERLSLLPEHFVRPLQVVQLSRMTRKKQSFPCYGMQWGAALYLYPLESDLVEHYVRPPKPAVMNESRMFGGRWVQEAAVWKLVWTEAAIKDFYLNNILIHELGHLLDERNTGYAARERYAEWFAVEYGYRRSRAALRVGANNGQRAKKIVRRHHRC